MGRKTLRPDEPFAKCLLFKQLWEEVYVGETYIITGKDLKFAKELTSIDNDTIVARLQVYLGDAWFGEHTRHGLASFVSNINKFIPEKRIEPVKRNQSERLMISCSACNSQHWSDEPCKIEDLILPKR